jgi:predicted  nucleic acid-binding Zn-ribbon protein
MASTATLLYRLQALDLAISQRISRIHAIDTLLSSDERVIQAQRSLEAAEHSLSPIQIRARDLDLEIRTIGEKVKLTDEHLYSGKVKNPKEMTELQEEIASLQRHQSTLEDELLETLVQVDDGKAAVNEALAVLETAKSAQANSRSELLTEKEQLETELVGLEAQREKGASAIDAASLQTYEALRPRKRGQAVALLKGESCALCNIEQTSVIVQQVWQGKMLVYCASCGRILAGSA